MFIGGSQTGYVGSAQVSLGSYLILFQKRGETFEREARKFEQVRALVRRVKLTQCGHWMMGQADLWGFSVGLSGAYGSDGFPIDMTEAQEHLWPDLHPVPEDLAFALWTDNTGWNSAGVKSGPQVHDWAKHRLDQLRRKYPSLKEHECAYCGIPSVYVTPPGTKGQHFCAECRERGPIPAVLAI